MTKRRHDQLGDAPTFVCTSCKADNCEQCVDVLRSVYSQQTICRCRRKNHAGEPKDQQVSDPFTGTVYGPGMRIKLDGTVQAEMPREYQ